MNYANGLREHLLRSVLQDMPDGAEIDVSLPPTTAYCVVEYPDGGSTRIPMEAGGHAFSLSNDGDATLPLFKQPPLSGTTSDALHLQFPNPASPSPTQARSRSLLYCRQCYEARKKCQGGIPCDLCSRRRLACETRLKPDSSDTPSTPATNPGA
ncbi:hypothetical protein C8T65DRAFT_669665 [Cerioporus squamosus]|nr:hypothetical protein C8T65DRAFT_669665 [Cerioporus squamosus]